MRSAPPPFAIRRSARARHARLTITRDGDAVVVLPLRAPERIALALVERHGAWLERQHARFTAERSRLEARPSLAEGRIVSVGGRPRFVCASDGQERAALERSLRAEAAALLRRRVAELAPSLGASPKRVTIRAQRSRWGSASRTGTISLNWRLSLAPPDVLDYVVVHELAHLIEAGHGRRFWSLVGRHAPQADAARRWLREHHADLQAVLD